MNIAIIVGEKIASEAVETFLRVYIKKFWSEYESSIHIEIFHSAKEFLTFFRPEIYHLVILGVNMQEITQFIRANSNNVEIIFLNDCGED